MPAGLGEVSDIFAASAINDSRNVRIKAFGHGAHGGIRLGIASQLFIPKDQINKRSDNDSSKAHMTDTTKKINGSVIGRIGASTIAGGSSANPQSNISRGEESYMDFTRMLINQL